MRKVGRVDTRREAELFGDYLMSEGIENQIDQADDDGWAIWVYRDSQMTEAKQRFADFRENPKAEYFIKGQRRVQETRKAKQTIDKKLEKRKKQFEAASQPATPNVGLFTAFILIITVGVGIWTGLGLADWSEARILPFQISMVRGVGLPEVMAGQVWRLLTPVFLHFDFLHIGFNLMAFVFLGQMIEKRGGTMLLVALFVLSGVGSNLCQYVFSGPGFGGLSGIDYALFGFIWMKSRFDPFSGYFLSDQTVVFALIWLVVCFTGMMGPIANIAHLSGLVFGVLWGFISARIRR